jgi:hypothetical protein
MGVTVWLAVVAAATVPLSPAPASDPEPAASAISETYTFANTNTCNIPNGDPAVYTCTASGDAAQTWTVR